MDHSFAFIIVVIIVALLFDFMNGFHDAANSIATIVSTRVLRPNLAVAWAAFFNFIAFLVYELKVANTIGKDVVSPDVVDPIVIFAALIGAIIWNVVTWYYGIPSSSSHALIGGLGGAAVAKAGVSSLKVAGFTKIGVSIVLSPLLGFGLSFLFMVVLSIVFFRSAPRKIDQWFRHLQFVSASFFSLSHGGNDAQKTMGIIAVLLYTAKMTPTFHVPFWVILACQVAMGLGTFFGGWRIVETMGMKITKLKPAGGFCAETAAALTISAATGLGIPVSTTHTISGSIMGVGAVRKFSAVRWGVAEQIVIAWVLTIPASAFVAGITWWVSHFFIHWSPMAQ